MFIDNTKIIKKFVVDKKRHSKNLCYVCDIIKNNTTIETHLIYGREHFIKTMNHIAKYFFTDNLYKNSKVILRPNPVEVEILNQRLLLKIKDNSKCNVIKTTKEIAIDLAKHPSGYMFPRTFIEIKKSVLSIFLDRLDVRIFIVDSGENYQILVPMKSFKEELLKNLEEDANIIPETKQELLIFSN